MKTEKTIPDSILEKIIAHRPYLGTMISNLSRFNGTPYIEKIEKSIADAYLNGASNLTMLETWYLSRCVVGLPYGGNFTD